MTLEHIVDGYLGYEKWRVKTVGEYHIEILPMAFGFRVVMTPVDCDAVYDRYWCYAGREPAGFAAAVLAATLWEGTADTEPVGWIKSWDGRRNEEEEEEEEEERASA